MSIRSGLRRHRPRRSQPAIIMYHRIDVPRRDPWNLSVTPENFRTQLRLLRRGRQLLPLDEFARLLGEDKLPRRAVAITFDDGYRDNLINGAPALAEFDAPATFFLATGPMRQQRGYWWDELAAMVLDAPALQGQVRIGWEDVPIRLGAPEPDDRSATWRAARPPRTSRESLYFRLWSLIRPLPPEEAERAMTELRAVFPAVADERDAPMTHSEVCALLSSAPVSLACHTVDHPDLPRIAPEIARAQILRNKAEVEALTGRTVDGFAYPYGRYNEDVVALVEEAGFTHACTSTNTPLSRCNPLTLPRITAKDRPSIDWLSI